MLIVDRVNGELLEYVRNVVHKWLFLPVSIMSFVCLILFSVLQSVQLYS